MDDTKQGAPAPLDFADLAGFQFGPSWARDGADSKATIQKLRSFDRPERTERPDRRRREDGRRPARAPHADGQERRDTRDFRDRRDRGERGPRPDHRTPREDRPQRELPAPAEGFRVELRPANVILELFSQKIQEQKRAYPLLDLARIVVAGKDRYDLVFMKQEGGSPLIHSTKGDGACWLTEAEAVAYLWQAPWFADLYKAEEIETEAPKGTFTAIATCTLGGELIGPANWHGYQAALMNLYRSKYAAMPLGAFKNRITTSKEEGVVEAWLAQVCKKNVWKPTREGAEDVVLEDAKAVEADFLANAYKDVYEVVDKVFINGNTPRKLLSPGLAAHLFILSDRTRRSPQMLIPNLCHGLARHHMPIYKWQGNHFTGPSRVRAIPADTVLADRMMAIVEWSKQHSGEKVDAMFTALTGTPAGTDEESRKAAQEAYAPYVADMLWLLEQGFIVVTSDNCIWYPKGEAAPAPTKVGNKGRRPQGKPAPKGAPKKQPKQPKPAAPKAEAPAAEAPAEPAPAPAEETPAPAEEAPAAE